MITYRPRAGHPGDLDQAHRECLALLLALENPEAVRALLDACPEAVAARHAAEGLHLAGTRPETPPRPCELLADGTGGFLCIVLCEHEEEQP